MKNFWQQFLAIITLAVARLKFDFMRTVNIIRQLGPNYLQLWLLAMVVGGVTGISAFYFVDFLKAVSRLLYRSSTDNLLYYTAALPWWWFVMIPTVGGLITGLILFIFTKDGRVRSISYVIEGAALNNGRVEEREGLASSFASFVTLAFGGSAGQEGPLVHFGAVIATRISNWLNVNGVTARDLLGAAAAAVIGAVFNAPLAGIVFAHEIILRHYSLSSFTPIAVASVTGTITGHILTGVNKPVLEFFEIGLSSYSELPAFLFLGLVSGFIAVIMMRSIFWAEDTGTALEARVKFPPWMRPVFAGLIIGVIAIGFPHTIGIGYQTTQKALDGRVETLTIIAFVAIKMVAVAVTIGGRMGGGVFSPSLMIGALTGLAFGQVAVALGGGEIGDAKLYALAGMAAVSAGVLGAPLSTSLIVLELTRNWDAALVVLASVSVATGVATRLVDKSFFLTQLERRGMHIAAGPQAYLQSILKVRAYMLPSDLDTAEAEDLRERGAFVYISDSFEEAFEIFEALKLRQILVLDHDRTDTPTDNAVVGVLSYVDVLRVYSQALANSSAEEHD